jgi:hypothetical protein
MGSNYINVLVKVFKHNNLNLARDILRFSPDITIQIMSHTHISLICYRSYVMLTIDSFINLKNRCSLLDETVQTQGQ